MLLSVLNIIKKLENYENIVYVDSLGNKTIGYGFNLDDPLASEIFETVVNKNYDKYSDFVSTFDDIYYGNIAITEELAHDILEYMWEKAYIDAIKRADELGISLIKEPFYKQVLVTDIQFNTGKIYQWKKVFTEKEPARVLYESRRHPEELMDNRVAKIGKCFGIINNIKDAHRIGLINTTNID